MGAAVYLEIAMAACLKFLFPALIVLVLYGCDDLVSSMDTHETLGAEDTAEAVNDIILMELNSTDGALLITFNSEGENPGVTVEAGTTGGCISLDGGGFFPYGTASWQAAFNLVFDQCSGDSGSLYNGTLSVGLSGPLGSISRYDFTGRIAAEGPVDGRIDIDLHYIIELSCILDWDCWSGSVNGYTVDQLRDALNH